MGFFLPIPPVAGGAVEKSWHRLTKEFAQKGHEVTLISRRWKDWPHDETINGVRHLRLSGYNHKKWLWLNLLCDLIWSIRVHRQLPDADIVASNTISLPCWLSALRPSAGQVVAMPGRMPKGQFRFYRKPARILVPSKPVQDAIKSERPSFASLTRVVGYPIAWDKLSNQPTQPHEKVTIGFVGRLHKEKGVELLVEALRVLAKNKLPPWSAVICGPADVANGGSGESFLELLRKDAPPQVEFHDPIYEEDILHQLYQSFDLFCYPSLAAQGETFGVSVAEAMAAGAVPIVSSLPCFLDFVIPDKTGLIFDATAPDAAQQLAAQLATLIEDHDRRAIMAAAAQQAVKCYDYSQYSDRLLEDFTQLTANPKSSTSQL